MEIFFTHLSIRILGINLFKIHSGRHCIPRSIDTAIGYYKMLKKTVPLHAMIFTWCGWAWGKAGKLSPSLPPSFHRSVPPSPLRPSLPPTISQNLRVGDFVL